jgi:hypothetical protein
MQISLARLAFVRFPLVPSSLSKRVSPTNDGDVLTSGLQSQPIFPANFCGFPGFEVVSFRVHFTGARVIATADSSLIEKCARTKNHSLDEANFTATSLICEREKPDDGVCAARHSAICDISPRHLALEANGRFHD